MSSLQQVIITNYLHRHVVLLTLLDITAVNSPALVAHFLSQVLEVLIGQIFDLLLTIS